MIEDLETNDTSDTQTRTSVKSEKFEKIHEFSRVDTSRMRSFKVFSKNSLASLE